jgi:hypothetical protein
LSWLIRTQVLDSGYRRRRWIPVDEVQAGGIQFGVDWSQCRIETFVRLLIRRITDAD